MLTILGIDPGSRNTGYGLIQTNGQKHTYVACGHIQTHFDDFNQRLKIIFQTVSQIIHNFLPHEVAIEQVFVANNPSAALKLGQARGAAIAAITQSELPLAEYSARTVKQSIVGYGGAAKDQMQQMVKMLLNLNQTPPSDAADALGIAICHAHNRKTQNILKAARQFDKVSL